MNPLNSAFRFVLEILALCAIGYWGWRQGTDRTRYILMLALPAIAAVAWGVFNVPGDPSRGGGAPVRVPGLVRVGVELAVFGSAAFALYGVGQKTPAIVFLGAVLLHYSLSLERLSWLVRQ
jgi:hypothetical protein